MTDAELRALVRDAVARHLGGGAQPVELRTSKFELRSSTSSPDVHAPKSHPSQYQYLALVNAGDACLIESSVECNHCGYCRSHGH